MGDEIPVQGFARRFQELFVDLAHHPEVQRCLAFLCVVERQPRDRQQGTLLADGHLGMARFNHGAPHFTPQGLSLRYKKSLATALARSLELMAFTGSPHDLGVQIFNRCLIKLRGRTFTAVLEHAGCAFQQRPFPLVDHRRVNAKPAGLFTHGLFALPGFQRNLGLELWMMLLSYRHF